MKHLSRLARRTPTLLPAHASALRLPTAHQRTLFGGLFGKKESPAPTFTAARPPRVYTPLYGADDLFHPLEQSPIGSLREKANVIKSLAPCPVCLDHSVATAKASGLTDAEAYRSARTTVEKVKYSCPDCGFPTHSTEAHWREGRAEHEEYCARLREINEDEHDLRSGREIKEFELPGAQDYESTASLGSWDTLFYTRNFASVDRERARRHVSKLLTYPMTVASVLHRLGPYAAGRTGTGKEGGRLTTEGQRSMAALHTSLHPPMGAVPSADTRNAKIPIRIFILGARAESSLPPHVFDQISHLFPYTRFKIYFIGPQAALPAQAAGVKPAPGSDADNKERGVYSPPTPRVNSETEGKGYFDTTQYGVPAYTISTSETMKLTTLQAPYESVHEQFGPFDPYTDVFFTFCPGLGFPSPTKPGTLQAQTEWHTMLTQVLATKCPLFITGFSPRDVERDVRSLDEVEGVKGEYDVILEPGENGFASLKWEAGDFDPRVLVRVNWGVWGIRGKRYEVGQMGRKE
ncbi:hypothetical protein QFC20_000762 [Naganishia adeliensis]|uniref:Uncharacterized protein n=1 Tax=Naganishia adeliensis TaxID=92952 RepID=A0ACC2WY41_9TREE|nr:hypothetical protein QFC20_000762 [Naganishia adeliensis]